MDGMMRTDTLSQCRVRRCHERGQTRENVTCEGVLFTHHVGRSRLPSAATSFHSTATMRYWKKKTSATFGIDENGLVQVVLLQILGEDGSYL